MYCKRNQMLFPMRFCVAAMLSMAVLGTLGASMNTVEASPGPRRILLDTDVDTDDFFALLYLLKLNRSQFHLEAVTINANAWTNAGHAVNQVYDLLYMMNRDDVAVGIGGEGGILPNGTILPNVGGYLPIIDQGMRTIGGCRYRQAIPVGLGGRLDIDANFGIRKAFLPQGRRKYTPLRQPTCQQVLIDKISQGPITLIVIGAHTNLAILFMTHPHLKKNVDHIYIMGGGVRSRNPTGCCPKNASSGCVARQCGDHGNLFTDYTSNPYAEFNIFGDPFAAYQVIHSGIPVTLVPLDATNTIPITREFFDEFEKSQDTYEAQYCFKSLKMARDTWFDDQFYTSYFMWDSFTSGVAASIMMSNSKGENEFAEMEYMNITVVTSNKPYGVYDGSNPLFDGLKVPKFNLKKGDVHSGHVQTGLRDPFCILKNGKGKCQVWDRRCFVTKGQPAGTLMGHLDGITFIDSRGDGRYLISNGKDQTTKLWDIRKMSSNAISTGLADEDWDYRWMDYPDYARNLKHPHDQSLATYKGHSVLRTLIRCYFSPSYTTGQKYIYTGSSDSSVYIYDLVSGAQVAKLDHHEAPVRDCSWHPFYPILVTSAWDGDIVRWEFPGSNEAPASPNRRVARRRGFYHI